MWRQMHLAECKQLPSKENMVSNRREKRGGSYVQLNCEVAINECVLEGMGF